jgi:tetratricopeptide (TPR) repeat protein
MMIHNWSRRHFLAAVLLLLSSIPSFADEFQEMIKASTELNTNILARRFKEAEPAARKLIALGDGAFREEPALQVMCFSLAATFYGLQGRDPEAEPLLQRVLQLASRLQATQDNLPAIQAIESVAFSFQTQNRYVEAEQLHRCSLAFHERLGKDAFANAGPLFSLGFLSMSQGRGAEAELFFRQALALSAKNPRPDFREISQGLLPLAMLYKSQGRFVEAEPLVKRAIERSEKLGGTSAAHVSSLVELASLQEEQKRYDEAEKLRQRILDLTRKMKTLEKPAWEAVRMEDLAQLHRIRGKLDEAEKFARQAIDHLEKAYSERDFHLMSPLLELARILEARGQLNEAMKQINRAFPLIPSGPRPHNLVQRGRLAWKLKQHDDAFRDLRQAMDRSEQERGRVSGGEQERARVFGTLSSAFELMVAWQAERGNPAETFLAAERARARALLEQLEVRGVDLLSGVPAPEAAKLRQRDTQARVRAAGIEKRMGLLAEDRSLTLDDRRKQREQLENELTEARRDALAVYREICHLSPAYRHSVGKERQPISLGILRRWVAREEALLLEYVLTAEGGFVIVVPGDGRKPRVEKLTVSKELARVLGSEPGPFTLGQAQEETATLLPMLARPGQSAQSIPRLEALWRLLVPAEERDLLSKGKIKRLMIVPDGPLTLVPFEALVLDAARPRYLLDTETPILYAPSATVLHHLAERPTSETPAGREPVLTVADPAYPGKTPSAESTLAQIAPAGRFRTARGNHNRLPHSASESNNLAENFRANGVKVAQLLQEKATESAVREGVAGRRLIHLACHGLADQNWGNFFGALALTPGKQAATDPGDDGFLTLGEIHALDLRTCELMILSACNTNCGPQQRGEGVWALSRGMLAAGSRRVVASNWIVEDAAAADLIQEFSASLAAATKKGGQT